MGASLRPRRHSGRSSRGRSRARAICFPVAPLPTPAEIAAALFDATRNEINQRARQLKADASLDPATRDAQLAALAAEARQRVTTAVTTPAGYDAYYEYQGGWILEITGTPPPPPGSP